MNDRELIEALDVCRAASNDLREPELQVAAQRVATDPQADQIRVRLVRIDAAILQAMHQAPLPVGFEDRLLARLNAAHGLTIGDQADDHIPASSAVSLPLRTDLSHSGRAWLAWSAGLATALAAVISTVLFLHREKPLTRADLDAAWQWREQLSESGQWQTLSASESARHSLPSELWQIPLRFRDASAVVGHDALAYDLTVPRGPRATLFVIEPSDEVRLPSIAPVQPQLSTMGYSIAYWQRGEALYVVVVESDRLEDYRMLLRTSVPTAV